MHPDDPQERKPDTAQHRASGGTCASCRFWEVLWRWDDIEASDGSKSCGDCVRYPEYNLHVAPITTKDIHTCSKWEPR